MVSRVDETLQARVAAYLYGQIRLSQVEVATRMGISQPKVSKLLELARDRRWLIDSRPHFDGSALSEEEMAEVRLRCYPDWDDLWNRLAPAGADSSLQDVRLFDSGSGETGPDEYDRRLRRLGEVAAEEFLAELPRMDRIGISWGKALAFFCEAVGRQLQGTRGMPRRPRPSRIFPVVGESFFNPNVANSSSNVAASLHRSFFGEEADPLPSLGAVAWVVPTQFDHRTRTRWSVSEADASVIRAFLASFPTYRRVFGEPGRDDARGG